MVRGRDPRLAQTMYVNDNVHLVTNNQPGGAANMYFMLPTFSSANEGKPATRCTRVTTRITTSNMPVM
ncbi:hypothetical protein [Chitinophaga niastensis]|uniref:hypothetical protein n=1 Tax=Chitinophaga niastensis TaxID=536980 RepID=UPI0011B23F85|nr:hypothetical protein [Chitinophaga niastensis]